MSTQENNQETIPPKGVVSRVKTLWIWLFGFPQHERLRNALDEYDIKLEHRLNGQFCLLSATPWAKAAKDCLERAHTALVESRFDSGWQHLHTAQSLEIWEFTEDELLTARQALYREAEKLGGWRKKTVESLLCDKKDSPDSERSPGSPTSNDSTLQRRELYQATLIRNEHFNNLYHKIRVRERSLKVAFLILGLIVIGAPLAARLFSRANWKMLAAVEFFGVLGAALSVASSLTRSTVDVSIPQQVLASVVIWMRPAIGAGAALVSYLFLKANLAPEILEPASPVSAMVFAFVAGFSERFIIGAVGKIVPDKN